MTSPAPSEGPPPFPTTSFAVDDDTQARVDVTAIKLWRQEWVAALRSRYVLQFEFPMCADSLARGLAQLGFAARAPPRKRPAPLGQLTLRLST